MILGELFWAGDRSPTNTQTNTLQIVAKLHLQQKAENKNCQQPLLNINMLNCRNLKMHYGHFTFTIFTATARGQTSPDPSHVIRDLFNS